MPRGRCSGQIAMSDSFAKRGAAGDGPIHAHMSDLCAGRLRALGLPLPSKSFVIATKMMMRKVHLCSSLQGTSMPLRQRFVPKAAKGAFRRPVQTAFTTLRAKQFFLASSCRPS